MVIYNDSENSPASLLRDQILNNCKLQWGYTEACMLGTQSELALASVRTYACSTSRVDVLYISLAP